MKHSAAKFKTVLSNKFAVDSIWLILSTALVGLSGLFTITIASANYGVAGMGALMQAIAIYTLCSTMGNLGIQTSAQKHASQFSDESEALSEILSSAILATALTSLAALFVINLLIFSYSEFLGLHRIIDILPLFLIAIPFFSINKTMNNFCAGLRLMKTHSLVKMSRWGVVIGGLLIIKDLPLLYSGWVFLIAEVIILSFLIFKLRGYLARPSIYMLNTHVSFGAKSVLGELTVTINSTVPTLLVGSALGNVSAGYFSYVENFARSILLISSAMQKNFNPVFTKLWYGDDRGDVEPHIKRMFLIQLALLAPALLVLTLGYYFYSYLLMDETYLAKFDLLIAFFPAIILVFLFGPLYGLLIMTSYLTWNFIRALLFVTCNLGLTIVLLPIFDLLGAAYALSIASLLNFAFFLILYKRLLKLDFLRIIFLENK